jgi:transcriptional regulator with XRE-family HTH domain
VTPAESFVARLGQELAALRIERGVNREDLAGRARMHRTTLAQYEGDRRVMTVSALDQLATALGVAPEELFR